MKRSWIIIVVCGLLLFIAGLGWYYRSVRLQNASRSAGQSQPRSQEAHTGHGASAGANEAEEDEEPPLIEIPEDKQRMLGVKTAEAAVLPLEKTIRTVGRVEYDERRLATVNTKFEGWIERLNVDFTGRFVKKGEALAEIYSPELVATQRELLSISRWQKGSVPSEGGSYGAMVRRDADALLAAARQRLKYWDITDSQISSIEETGETIRTLTVYSPVSGYVVQKMALQGMRVMPGEKLFDIADLSSLWVLADIYESELGFVNEGQRAKIMLSVLPGKELFSRVEYVYPTLAGETRTVKIRFSVPNSGGKLKPQMFTDVEIRVPLGRKLAIPEDAVIDTGERQIVYLDQGDGFFEPREVRLGVRAEGYREVVAGLQQGDRVASSATFLVDSEAQLKGVRPLSGHKH